MVDSVSVVSVSSTSRSDKSSPVRWISPFFAWRCLIRYVLPRYSVLVHVALRMNLLWQWWFAWLFLLFRMVASIYNPLSVNALGSTVDFFQAFHAVEIFHHILFL